mgnify:CR=1 FL=1
MTQTGHIAHDYDDASAPAERSTKPGKGAFIRELREITGSPPPRMGQLPLPTAARKAAPPEQMPAQQSDAEKAALIRELVEMARNGAQRDVDQLRQDVADDMARIRDMADDLPI